MSNIFYTLFTGYPSKSPVAQRRRGSVSILIRPIGSDISFHTAKRAFFSTRGSGTFRVPHFLWSSKTKQNLDRLTFAREEFLECFLFWRRGQGSSGKAPLGATESYSLSLWSSVNNEFINRRAALPPLRSRRKEALSHLSKLWPASLVVGRYYCCTVCRRRWLWAGNGAGKFQRNAKPGGENGTEPRLEGNLLWVLGDFFFAVFCRNRKFKVEVIFS